MVRAHILLLFSEKLYNHKSLETIMVYTHVVAEMNRSKVCSPLDLNFGYIYINKTD